MRLYDFLNLPNEHNISFEDGQALHKDIVLNGVDKLNTDQSRRLRDYLEACLVHESVEPDMLTSLDEIYELLKKRG